MHRLDAIALCLLALSCACLALAQEEPTGEEPRETGLVERTAARLAQIDVTVTGRPEVVADLGPEDFSLRINFRTISDFRLDRICEAPPEADAGDPSGPPVSYLLFFDQPHLTLAGRQRALDVAERLASRLLADGGQAMIVSNARRLKIMQEFTSNLDELHGALRLLEGDRGQWDFFTEQEEQRVAEVIDSMNRIGLRRGANLARTYQQEEIWVGDKSLRRLALSLSWLADVDPPKVVLLFSDALRENPGEHYVGLFGRDQLEPMEGQQLTLDNLQAQGAFDRLVNAASAQGIRFYPVLARGLVTAGDTELPSGEVINRTGSFSVSERLRQRETRVSMGDLSAETGGYPFVNGETPARISQKILRDFSCIYLISFDPVGFSNDAPLRLILKSNRPGVTLHARGRLVVQSESTRRTARLLSAFALESSEQGNGSGVRASLVPTGFHDGAYTALLQVSVPGTALSSATWDLGASMVFQDRVRDEASARLEVHQPGLPVVLEHEVRLHPGQWEIVAVAHETTTDIVLSERVSQDWPDLDGQVATCGPVAVLQPTAGAFVRGGEQRESGSLARPASEAMHPDRPTALMGLVCRGKRHKAPLDVERSLIGESEIEFPPLELKLGDDRCAQVRDLIPAGVLGPGGYRYEVRVFSENAAVDVMSRDFFVVE